MKKLFCLIVILLSVFSYNNSVFAKEYTCKYYYYENDQKQDAWIKFDVNEEKGSYDLKGDFWGADLGGILKLHYVIDFALDDRYSSFVKKEGNKTDIKDNDGATKVLINDVLKGNCAEYIYLCSSSENNLVTILRQLSTWTDPTVQFIAYLLSSVNKYGVLLNTSLHEDFVKQEIEIDGNWIPGSFKKDAGDETCVPLELEKSESTGGVVDIYVTTCQFYTQYIKKDEQGNIVGGELYDKYNQCNTGDCLNDYNEIKDKLKSFCSNSLKNGDYTVDPCVNHCLSLADDIRKIEGYSVDTGECNFSDRVVKWIANIVKWAKYIAPILVIIFGIMDFIKAIAAQSEDEMKKAQSRFIKRLIVAALVFIVPFLIEYVLTAFKIVPDNPYCGII